MEVLKSWMHLQDNDSYTLPTDVDSLSAYLHLPYKNLIKKWLANKDDLERFKLKKIWQLDPDAWMPVVVFSGAPTSSIIYYINVDPSIKTKAHVLKREYLHTGEVFLYKYDKDWVEISKDEIGF